MFLRYKIFFNQTNTGQNFAGTFEYLKHFGAHGSKQGLIDIPLFSFWAQLTNISKNVYYKFKKFFIFWKNGLIRIVFEVLLITPSLKISLFHFIYEWMGSSKILITVTVTYKNSEYWLYPNFGTK